MTSICITPTIFIVEDDPIVCDNLRQLFSSISLNVETFVDAQTYLYAHNPHKYGCLLIDIDLPGMDGLTLQEGLLKLNNPIPIVIMTGHNDVSLAVQAMKLGAKDFILKPFDNEVLLRIIEKILGESLDEQHHYHCFANLMSKLTSREREILDLVVDGKMNKEIADLLNIAVSTVEQHRSHIIQKMQIKSIIELVNNYNSAKRYIA